jgi:transcriptional regulator with XRE-family HTH domain
MSPNKKYSEEILELLSDPEARLVWEEEGILISFALGVEKALDARNMNQSDLARKIGKSPQSVSRALSGNQNLSLRTMLEIAIAVGQTVKIEVQPIQNLNEVAGPDTTSHIIATNYKAKLDRPAYSIPTTYHIVTNQTAYQC